MTVQSHDEKGRARRTALVLGATGGETAAALLRHGWHVRHKFIGQLPKLPLEYFEEPAPLAPNWPTTQCAYLQLSSAYQREAEQAERLGWLTRCELRDHLAMLTQPREIGEAIRLLIGEMEALSVICPRGLEKRCRLTVCNRKDELAWREDR